MKLYEYLRLCQCLERAGAPDERLNHLRRELQALKPRPPHALVLPVNEEHLRCLKASYIIWVEAAGNYVWLGLAGSHDAPVFVSRTLQQIEMLPACDSLLRVHRKFLINPEHIETVCRWYHFVIMTDAKKIPVSRPHIGHLRMALGLNPLP